MSSHRLPRRTRVYDANYNIGQSYYKPTLDNLDRKYYGRSTESAPPVTPRVNFDIDDKFEDDLKAARSRAARAIAEDTVFDSRGIKSRKGAPISSIFDDDIDEDVKLSLNRISAAKKTIAATLHDFETEDASPIRHRASETTRKFLEENGDSEFKNGFRSRKLRDFDNEDDSKPSARARRLLELNGDEDTGRSKFRSRKLLEMNGDEDMGSKARSRALKGITRFEDDVSANSSSLTSSIKRVAISDSVETVSSAASMRAKASKARLADIESEMSERSDRLMEREKRAANLKKILAESEMEAIAAN